MNCKTENCDRKALTRGLCRACYDRGRQGGTLSMVGTSKKGGRPKGKVKSSPLGEWMERETPTKADIQAVSFKRMITILESPESNQQEVIALIKVAAGFEVEGGNEDLKEQLAEVVKLARGDA